jgi:hypothetical protein
VTTSAVRGDCARLPVSTLAIGQPHVPTQHRRRVSAPWGAVARRTLQQLGANVAGPTPREFNGLQIDLWPRVSWSPLFALTWDDVEARPSWTVSHAKAISHALD